MMKCISVVRYISQFRSGGNSEDLGNEQYLRSKAHTESCKSEKTDQMHP